MKTSVLISSVLLVSVTVILSMPFLVLNMNNEVTAKVTAKIPKYNFYLVDRILTAETLCSTTSADFVYRKRLLNAAESIIEEINHKRPITIGEEGIMLLIKIRRIRIANMELPN